MTETKRLFVAVPLPDDILDYVERVQANFQKEKSFEGRNVLRKHQHITISFLGEVSEDQIPLIQDALATIRIENMFAHLFSVDYFSSGDKIRVLFIYVICPELITLSKNIELVLSEWTDVENRSFAPHITLARVKLVFDKHALLDFVNRYEIEKKQFKITQFALFESVQVKGELEHRVLQLFI